MADLFRPATIADAVAIAPYLRQCDLEECEALAGKGSALMMTVATVSGASLAYAYEKNGDLVCLFGVCGTLLSSTGKVWMFGTDVLSSCGKRMRGVIGVYLAEMFSQYPRLENVVDARNRRSIRWLKRIGFIFGEPVKINGFEFFPFSKEV